MSGAVDIGLRLGGGTAAARPMGVGIDLVEVSQIAESLRRFPERFARRLFTAAEIADCEASALRAPARFAARFAAKEAGMKALGLTEGVDWRELEVVGIGGDTCTLVLHGEVARRAGTCVLALALGGAGDLATAMVVADWSQPAPSPAATFRPPTTSAPGPSPYPRGEQTHSE